MFRNRNFSHKKSNKKIKATLYSQKLIYEHILIMINYTMINPTNTSVYLNRTLGWRQINVRKIFHEVTNVSYGQR